MKLKIILLFALIFFTLFLRMYKVDQVPSSLYYDEIDAGYQARSIIQTGKDYRNTLSPFFVNSFLDPRPPMPIYFTVLSTLLFKTPELQVRMSSVILGVLNVVLVFWLINLWRKNFWQAYLVALVFATNPWQIQFSRFNHEGNSTIFFVLLGLNLFYKAIKNTKSAYLFFASAILSLGMYTYRIMSLYVPLIFILLSIIYRKEIFKFGYKKILVAFILMLSITLPFLYKTTIGASDKPRISQISIFSDPKIPILVQRNRELDSHDIQIHPIGKRANTESYFFHNKILSYLQAFTRNYFSTFSVDFLFIKGDLNHRHSIPNQGMMFYTDVIAIIFGFSFLLKNLRRKEIKLLIFLLLISPIPSSLTGDGAGHGARLYIFSLPLLIFIGFGWSTFLEQIIKLKYSKILISLILSIWLFFFIFYLHSYFVHFPVESANMFGYGYKQADFKILSEEKNYKKVEMTQTKDPPILYFLFWANIPPRVVQKYGSQFSGDIIKNQFLDKYKTSSLPIMDYSEDSLIASMNPETLYLVTNQELPLDLRNGKKPPKGIKVIDIINYPDGEVDFYLIAKDSAK